MDSKKRMVQSGQHLSCPTSPATMNTLPEETLVRIGGFGVLFPLLRTSKSLRNIMLASPESFSLRLIDRSLTTRLTTMCTEMVVPKPLWPHVLEMKVGCMRCGVESELFQCCRRHGGIPLFPNLKKLTLPGNAIQEFTSLPDSLEELCFDDWFSHPKRWPNFRGEPVRGWRFPGIEGIVSLPKLSDKITLRFKNVNIVWDSTLADAVEAGKDAASVVFERCRFPKATNDDDYFSDVAETDMPERFNKVVIKECINLKWDTIKLLAESTIVTGLYITMEKGWDEVPTTRQLRSIARNIARNVCNDSAPTFYFSHVFTIDSLCDFCVFFDAALNREREAGRTKKGTVMIRKPV